MYCTAENLAVHENKKFLAELGVTKGNMDMIKGFELIAEHRKERIDYHLNEMKKLLEMSLKYNFEKDK